MALLHPPYCLGKPLSFLSLVTRACLPFTPSGQLKHKWHWPELSAGSYYLFRPLMKKKRATQSLLNNKKDWHELNERESRKKSKTHFQCFVLTVNENGEDKKRLRKWGNIRSLFRSSCLKFIDRITLFKQLISTAPKAAGCLPTRRCYKAQGKANRSQTSGSSWPSLRSAGMQDCRRNVNKLELIN